MKKKIEFDEIVRLAKLETGGGVDVADAVLGRLKVCGDRVGVSYKPLAVIASFSSAAAACIAILVIRSFATGSMDGLGDVYQAISWVVQ